MCAYYGRVASVVLKKSHREDSCYWIGFVKMVSHEEAALVIQMLNKQVVEVC